jgi:4a-hydroxytetrahydrobiopterin dehydratase
MGYGQKGCEADGGKAMRERLEGAELKAAVAGLADWKLEKDGLVRTVIFPDFPAAMAFVNRAAELAQEADHHPDIDIRFNKIRIALTTHSAGGVTKMDVDMAARLDAELQ